MPTSDPETWVRWLPESADHSLGTVATTAALPLLTVTADDSTRQRFSGDVLVRKWASGPASLPWNVLAIELIVKYQ